MYFFFSFTLYSVSFFPIWFKKIFDTILIHFSLLQSSQLGEDFLSPLPSIHCHQWQKDVCKPFFIFNTDYIMREFFKPVLPSTFINSSFTSGQVMTRTGSLSHLIPLGFVISCCSWFKKYLPFTLGMSLAYLIEVQDSFILFPSLYYFHFFAQNSPKKL